MLEVTIKLGKKYHKSYKILLGLRHKNICLIWTRISQFLFIDFFIGHAFYFDSTQITFLLIPNSSRSRPDNKSTIESYKRIFPLNLYLLYQEAIDGTSDAQLWSSVV